MRECFQSRLRLGSVIVSVGMLAVACGGGAASGGLSSPDGIPAVNTEVHSVPLDEILFDTFDGGSVPLSEADSATILRLLDAIPPIDTPDYEAVSDALWLTEDDVVLGYVDDDGDAWAYPIKILDLHEIVNDDLGGRPVLISYCPLCGSGIVYDRRVGDDRLTFSNTSALHENDMVMVDRETGSYWWQVAGSGIVGPLTGEALAPLPSEMARWSDWRLAHPDGQVLVRPTQRDYLRDRFVGYRDRVDAGLTPFPVSDSAMADDRLAPGAMVVAAEVDGEVVAWPVDPPMTTSAVMGGLNLQIVTDGTGGRVVDSDSGEPLPIRTLLWFALVATNPDAVLGQS